MSDSDWLETEEPTAHLPAVVEIPVDLAARLALIEDCWSRLTLAQKTFLSALRENRFNARKTARKLGQVQPTSHKSWLSNRGDYATVFRAWQAAASGDALDRDRLLVRQDDIVETLLTPKPILHQGEHTGFEEVDASAAARANETLMKAAGLLKDKEVDLNIGIIGPAFTIQVVQPAGDVIDVTPRGVPVQLPEPDADWTE